MTNNSSYVIVCKRRGRITDLKSTKWPFADDYIKRLYVNTVTKRVFIPLYMTDISTKFEDIPYIRLRDFDHSSFKFPKLQALNLKMF